MYTDEGKVTEPEGGVHEQYTDKHGSYEADGASVNKLKTSSKQEEIMTDKYIFQIQG
jgi:hypothetical protein